MQSAMAASQRQRIAFLENQPPLAQVLTISSIAQLRRALDGYRHAGERIGLVPTMGNLHEGHLSLVDEAVRHADRVVVSIFVNPTQFGPHEDFARYPRTEQADAEQLAARRADMLFLPTVATMYGELTATTMVTVPALNNILCGIGRPGHFDGVATVVCKLFNLVQPQLAIFGQKDFQQLTIIRRMVKDLCLPVEIIGCQTYRERDGLAMSSRNRYLDAPQRAIAPRLYQALQQAVKAAQSGESSLKNINNQTKENLTLAGFEVEYVEIRRQKDLKMPESDDTALIILAAARLGQARLIDNIAFELP